MRVVIFCHSVLSDWNNGNAHFLRGVATELVGLGHEVRIYEPRDGWSVTNLVKEHGERPLESARIAFSTLRPVRYEARSLDLSAALQGADAVLVHEWNEPELVRAIGRQRARQGGFALLFHDTHHRALTSPQSLQPANLADYDGVLAFGDVLRDLYLSRGFAPRAFTWHEAADTRVFRPLPGIAKEGDLVWVGNWGDEERSAELHEFLLEPVRKLRLRARVHGVRYPEAARHALLTAGVEYAGWLPNHLVPRAFAAFRVTVHVPRRHYAESLPGIPTIRPFEALACGMPLVSAPWNDVEGLFEPGRDYLCARDGEEMAEHLRSLVEDPGRAAALGAHGRRTVNARHTCRHRAEELLAIVAQVRGEARQPLSELATA